MCQWVRFDPRRLWYPVSAVPDILAIDSSALPAVAEPCQAEKSAEKRQRREDSSDEERRASVVDPSGLDEGRRRMGRIAPPANNYVILQITRARELLFAARAHQPPLPVLERYVPR